MKIAIPIADLAENKKVISGGFNSTGQICIYDNDTNEIVWMKTTDLATNIGDLLPALLQKRVSDIITYRIQPMALKVLENKGFNVYKSKGTLLDENIICYNQKELPLFDMKSAMAEAISCKEACSNCRVSCGVEENTKNKKQAF
jgi:Uncharacterized conserved protein